MSPKLVENMADDLMDVEVSGATIHFTPQKPIPVVLVEKISLARVFDELNK
jgi:hypothetical protein